jgi:hypothetical protein
MIWVLREHLDRFVGPASPQETLDDKVVGHVGCGDLEVWGWGLNRLVATQPPNLALWPNICPSAKIRVLPDHLAMTLAKLGGTQNSDLRVGMHTSPMRPRRSRPSS